jgi:retron-type reverse transcriptase
LKKVQNYVEAGYDYAVDMDLEKYFDTVNQSKLIEVLSRAIKDGRVISLIHKYLRAGVLIGGKFEATDFTGTRVNAACASTRKVC